MIDTQRFIERSQQQFDRISFLDALRSSFPVYLAMGLFLILIGINIALASGFTGAILVVVFIALMTVAGYLWVKLFQHYELRSPVKAKLFAQRLSAFLQSTRLNPELSGKAKNGFQAILQVNGNPHPVQLEYSQSLSRSLGGIILGGPVSTAMFRPIHPRTWFLKIQGSSERLRTQRVYYDFSARKKDTDTLGGQGIRLYDLATDEAIKKPDPELSAVTDGINHAISGTWLKGTLVFDQGLVTLTLFDTLSGVHKWKKPRLRFNTGTEATRLKADGVPLEQAAFYGADRLIQLSFSR